MEHVQLALEEIRLRRVSGQKMHKEKSSLCCKIILVAHCMGNNLGEVAYVLWYVLRVRTELFSVGELYLRSLFFR